MPAKAKVMRAMHRAQQRPFRIFPNQTDPPGNQAVCASNHGGTIIARSPDRYGFTQDPVSPHEFEEVVGRPRIAFPSDLPHAPVFPMKNFRLLNPELRRDAKHLG